LEKVPEAASLHHALGLLRVRQSDLSGALKHLQKAVLLEPDNARYGYVYGIALNSAGKVEEAIATLTAIDTLRPYDLDILGALISVNREAGNNKAALVYARKAAEALPDDPNLKQLIKDLETAK
jgi:Flp pilus assembly protein TadD